MKYDSKTTSTLIELEKIDTKICLSLIEEGRAKSLPSAVAMLSWMIGDGLTHNEFVHNYIMDKISDLLIDQDAISFYIDLPAYFESLKSKHGIFYVTVDGRNYYFMPE